MKSQNLHHRLNRQLSGYLQSKYRAVKDMKKSVPTQTPLYLDIEEVCVGPRCAYPSRTKNIKQNLVLLKFEFILL